MQPQPVIFLVSHPSRGGVQELWTDLAEGFASAGHQVRLIALYPSPQRQDNTLELAWHNVCDTKPSGILGGLRLVAALVRLFRRERPLMVFAAMPAANVLAPLAASLAGIGTPVCISHHSPVSTHPWLLNMVDNLTGSLDTTRSIVSVSNAVNLSLDTKPRSYRQKRCTIRNSLPPRVEARLQSLSSARAARPSRCTRVVAIGRLAEQKNYPVLLHSAKHVPDIEITIVGSGPLHDSLRQLADELNVSSRVHFLGQLTREATMEVLASADVFAQPSVFEGHSLALLEAARLGLPLVVSDVPSQIEAITRTDGARCGIVVGLHDDLGLAHAFQHLMDTPASYQYWANAALQLAGEATYSQMIQSYQLLITT